LGSGAVLSPAGQKLPGSSGREKRARLSTPLPEPGQQPQLLPQLPPPPQPRLLVVNGCTASASSAASSSLTSAGLGDDIGAAAAPGDCGSMHGEIQWAGSDINDSSGPVVPKSGFAREEEIRWAGSDLDGSSAPIVPKSSFA
jgi:hypothetical protein